MRYEYAKKLHNGDEVLRKKDGASPMLLNISTEITDFGKKLIILECDDGNTYYHTDVK